MHGRMSFIDILTLFDTFLQIADFDMTTKDLSNNDIMQVLERQNKEYLERIVINQEKILEKLSSSEKTNN